LNVPRNKLQTIIDYPAIQVIFDQTDPEVFFASHMSTVGHHQAVGPYQQPQEMEEKARGRERNRDGMMDGSGGQAIGGPLSSSSDPPSRKRRRSRKGLDKKFECPEEGCGRSYSRAEHLYRHQLNRKVSLKIS